MAPLTAQGSASSDYFGDDDPAFLQALQDIELPGETSHPNTLHKDETPNNASLRLKRAREPTSDDEDTPRTRHTVLASIDDDAEKSKYLQSNIYGASSFGGFGEYMSRKRAKLQIQNAEMDEEEKGGQSESRIFRGLQIYVS